MVGSLDVDCDSLTGVDDVSADSVPLLELSDGDAVASCDV